ncbi:MAG: hypothetical protein DRG78_16005 [Epsilonproteobacteria bacterium]|nr:MAG: hypothetical protein DRG78_16005 [Campylobacterota bacterium]
MIHKLYIDLWAGQDLKYVTATSSPGAKIPGCTRYLISVDLPDHNLPDVELHVLNIEEVQDG